MKKHILASASALALFAAIPAAAQTINSSDIKQGSTANRATVQQQRTAGRDSSVIEQNAGSASGGNNVAEVTQSGPSVSNASSSQSSVFQTGAYGTAKVRQQTFTPLGGAERNVSSIFQRGTATAAKINLAEVDQNGHNESLVDQKADGNTARIKQGVIGGQPVGGNYSEVDQDGDDTATVNQNTLVPATGTGNYGGNRSDIDQTTGANTATVDQTGLSDRANTTLGSYIFQANGATANVTQNGDRQDSDVFQFDGGRATVTQSGADNVSGVTQRADATAFVTQAGERNDSQVEQNADGAFANVDQTQTGGSASAKNDSNVTQNASANTNVIQNGSGNNSTVNQNAGSTSSFAIVAQGSAGGQSSRFAGRPAFSKGSVGNTSTVEQNGFDFAVVGQSGTGNTSGVTQNGDGDAFVQQVGDRNRSTVNQSGFQRGRDDANRAYAVDVQQLGNDGYSLVNQSGGSAVAASQPGANRDGNLAVVRQLEGASFAQSTINQAGTDNIVRVTQGGSAGFGSADGEANVSRVTQEVGSSGNTATVFQFGDFNTSDITQRGSGHTATVTQNSDSNVSTITQSGSGNSAIVTQGS